MSFLRKHKRELNHSFFYTRANFVLWFTFSEVLDVQFKGNKNEPENKQQPPHYSTDRNTLVSSLLVSEVFVKMTLPNRLLLESCLNVCSKLAN